MVKDYKILYKFPTRSRPDKFFAAIENIISMSASNNYKIVVTIDEDDETMNNDYVASTVLAHQKSYDLLVMLGNSEGKIHAVNRDMDKITNAYDWDIVVVMSDDMKFVVYGFDNAIRAAFDKYGLDSVIHFNDGNSYKDKLMTLNVQGRINYDRFKYLYNPEYISLWCDNEQMEVAKLIGNYYYMGDKPVIVNHLHPCHVQGVVYDDLLRHTETFYRVDEQTFLKRKKKNFDIKTIEK